MVFGLIWLLYGYPSLTTTRWPQSFSVVFEVAAQKKADFAVKRARQAETRRLRNKRRKSEVRTSMRKVMEALDVLKKKTGLVPKEVISIETLIAEAYSDIDKPIGKGTLHRNTGANRKSRLARNKKAVEIHHGWYTPAPDLTVLPLHKTRFIFLTERMCTTKITSASEKYYGV
ncbi:hypothetical protein RND81_11G120900 [Saponaria officinalis]|uniref:Small ribosomal subunit protein bS20c n=1 Tax=Saponaria officinalis TaxID=3572 RepID=A0AAW1HL20_SAPOF